MHKIDLYITKQNVMKRRKSMIRKHSSLVSFAGMAMKIVKFPIKCNVFTLGNLSNQPFPVESAFSAKKLEESDKSTDSMKEGTAVRKLRKESRRAWRVTKKMLLTSDSGNLTRKRLYGFTGLICISPTIIY
jgi:hypothetical protein